MVISSFCAAIFIRPGTMHVLAREELMLSCAGGACALIHNMLALKQGHGASEDRGCNSMQIFPD